MVTAVEQRFGRLNRLLKTIEWLTDNGSCYTAADTRRFAREIGFLPLHTPIESPQSNGMAEAFVRIFKRDYVTFNPKPDAATVIQSLPAWFGIPPGAAAFQCLGAEGRLALCSVMVGSVHERDNGHKFADQAAA